ncbi:response regulator transcription factor [Sphingobacterium multivorum]|uniref:response regulator transcription factor n=1 Tax=Sphingobacterium multivorum TaxID=28454 RepID=UPI000E07339D|nr:response regulator transcription factor [Sphingobacterium multivorum]QQT46065.1 response regulator transcription factor [Sphingobacterium multivorum]SUJ30771.1 Response regulator protein vraR [Sphingobacterium multivorum]
MIKVAIVDDHNILRESLTHLINSYDNIEVVITAENGKEFLERLSETATDIVLLDLQMPVMDGYKTCEILHRDYPEIKVLVLSHLNGIADIKRMMGLGAHGYFTKNAATLELREAIIKLNSKGFFFEKKLEAAIQQIRRNPFANYTAEKPVLISEREIEIIKMVANAMSSKQVADILNISTRTVETHKQNLIERTGSKNFINVIFYALSHEIISFQDIET